MTPRTSLISRQQPVVRRVRTAAPIALFACFALTALPSAQAQSATDFAYIAKFVCGANGTGSASIPSVNSYQDLQPGGYATVLNVLNLSFLNQQVRVRATVADPSPASFPRSVIVVDQSLLRTGLLKVGCGEITAALGQTNGVVEGVLSMIHPNDHLDVQAVFTYSDYDEFQNERFLGIGVNNQVGDIQAPAPGSNGNVTTGFRIMGGAGSGGLGIGTSIDVERIEPREMPTPPTIDPIVIKKPLP